MTIAKRAWENCRPSLAFYPDLRVRFNSQFFHVGSLWWWWPQTWSSAKNFWQFCVSFSGLGHSETHEKHSIRQMCNLSNEKQGEKLFLPWRNSSLLVRPLSWLAKVDGRENPVSTLETDRPALDTLRSRDLRSAECARSSHHKNTPPFTATKCDWSLDLSKKKNYLLGCLWGVGNRVAVAWPVDPLQNASAFFFQFHCQDLWQKKATTSPCSQW